VHTAPVGGGLLASNQSGRLHTVPHSSHSAAREHGLFLALAKPQLPARLFQAVEDVEPVQREAVLLFEIVLEPARHGGRGDEEPDPGAVMTDTV
jgi:hypothetical protein